MAISFRLILILTLIFFVSCATSETKPSPGRIEDLRLKIDCCPVHNEPLIESIESVDMERGSYMPEYYQIRSELFPCAYDDPHSVGEPARVTFCPKCRFAKARYLKDKNQPEPPWELFGKDEEEFFKQRKSRVDAFVARHRRELEEHYQKEMIHSLPVQLSKSED